MWTFKSTLRSEVDAPYAFRTIYSAKLTDGDIFLTYERDVSDDPLHEIDQLDGRLKLIVRKLNHPDHGLATDRWGRGT